MWAFAGLVGGPEICGVILYVFYFLFSRKGSDLREFCCGHESGRRN